MDKSLESSSSAINFLNLPIELKLLILSYLNAVSLVNLRGTSREFKEIIDSECFLISFFNRNLKKPQETSYGELRLFLISQLRYYNHLKYKHDFIDTNHRLLSEILSSPDKHMEVPLLQNIGPEGHQIMLPENPKGLHHSVFSLSPDVSMADIYHVAKITCLEISSSGLIAVTADQGTHSNIKIWDLLSNTLHKAVSNHESGVYVLKIVGGEFFSGDESGFIARSCLSTGALLQKQKIHKFKDCITSIIVDGKNCIGISTCGFSCEIDIWSAETLQLLNKVNLHSQVQKIAFSKTEHYVFSLSNSGMLHYWNYCTGEIISKIHTGRFPRQISTLHPTITGVLFNGKNDALAFWNLTTSELHYITPTHKDAVRHFVFLPGMEKVLLADSNGALRLYNCNTGQLIRYAAPQPSCDFDLKFLLASPDGKYAAAGSANGCLSLWSIETLQCIQTTYHVRSFTAGDFVPNQRMLLTISEDYTLRRWGVLPIIEYEKNRKIEGGKEHETKQEI